MKLNLLKDLSYCFCLVLVSTFSNAQTQQWVARYSGTANQPDIASVMYVDAAGNSYAAGYAYDTVGGTGEDFAVVKFDTDGNLLWSATHRDAGFSYAEALTVDPSGNVFITGYSTNLANNSFLLIKYDSQGVLQWTKYLGAAGSLQDEGMALAADNNFVYVAGRVIGNGFPYYHNIFTYKLDNAGNTEPNWPTVYNGTGNNEDVPTSITIDESGNVIVAGWSTNSSGDKDYVVNVYDPSGASLAGWPQVFDGPDNLDDIPVQVVTNGAYIAVTGNCNVVRNTGVGDIGTVLYDYNGNIVNGSWPQVYNGPANDWDGVGNTGSSATCKPLALDNAGNVYVGGWSKNSSGNYDLITFKYDISGNNSSGWPVLFDNGGQEDITRGLSLDASEDVIISGFTSPAGTFNNGNFFTFEYDPSGNVMAGWPVYYDGPVGGDDQANAVVAEGQYIWVAGYSGGAGTFSDFTVIKYSNGNPTVAVHEPASGIAVGCYPNPASGKFILHTKSGSVDVIITNVLGELVFKTKSLSPLAPIDLSNQPAGIYFYRIIAENGAEMTGKVILQ